MQYGNFTQNRVIMRGLMRISPTQRVGITVEIITEPDQRIIQGAGGNLIAGFKRRALDHITPNGGAFNIAVYPFNKQGFNMCELFGQWPQFVADQSRLNGAQPRGIDQGFGQMFVHLSIPIGQ